MKRVLRLTLCLILVFLGAYRAFPQAAPPPPPKPVGGLRGDPVLTWQETRVDESNFKVTLPSQPYISTQTVESPLGKLPMRTLALRSGPVLYGVLCGEYPIAFDTPSSARNSLNGARDMTLGQSAGKLLSESEITYGKFPGREWKALTNRGLIRARMYLVQHRFYALMATMPEAADAQAEITAEVNRVFDSFQLLKEPGELPKGIISIAQFNSNTDHKGMFAQLRDRPLGWREFASPRDGFKLQLPSEPLERTLPVIPNNPALDIQLLAARGEKLICLVMTQRVPGGTESAAFRELIFKDLLGGLSAGFAKGIRGEVTLLSQTPTSLQGHPGHEYNLRLDGPAGVLGRGTGRSFLIKDTIYVLVGLALGESTEGKEVARFLDSFNIPNLAPPAAEAEKPFTSDAGNFAVQLPGIRSEGTLPLETPSGKVEMHFVSGEALAGNYTVIYSDFPPLGSTESFLQGVIQGMQQSTQAKLQHSANITLSGFPGKHVILQLPTGQTMQAKFFLVNWRLYQIRAVVSAGQSDLAELTTFFDSFKLLKAPGKDSPPPPPPPLPELRQDLIPPDAVKVSGGILQGMLATKKVQPEYPPVAKAAGAQGPVSIQVTLSETGELLSAVVLDGHPLLRDPALAAARQWRFKPHIVNGKPVKAVGVLIFHFTLK